MAVYPSSTQASSRNLLPKLRTPTLSLSSGLPPLQHPQDASQAATTRRRGNCTLAMLLGDNTGDGRCRYPSKSCRNTRVRKSSGALHRYCAYHRNRANANQKRWVGRQRDAALSPSSSSSSWSEATSSPSCGTSPTPTKLRWIVAKRERPSPLFEECSFKTVRPTDALAHATVDAAALSDDDWDALLSLLTPAVSMRSNVGVEMSVGPTKRARY